MKTLMACVYHVINKAEKLGADVAYKIYQVLRNRLGGLYTKMKWTGNGAKITGAGDPLDIWDDFIHTFNAKLIPPTANSLPGEINYQFDLGGNRFYMRYYPSSSSSGEPTIAIVKGSFEFKLRF